MPKRKSRRATCAIAARRSADRRHGDRPPARPPRDRRHRARRCGMAHAGGERIHQRGRATSSATASISTSSGAPLRARGCTPARIGAEEERARLALDLAAGGQKRRAHLLGRCRHLRLSGAGLRAARPRGAARLGGASKSRCRPGCSAMQAAAARAGAPLGHDFCAISLSDLLTPWPAIRAASKPRRRAIS